MNLNEQVPNPLPDYRTIPLTQGKVAIVDAADYDLLSGRTWRAMKVKYTWYARTTVRLPDGRRTQILMHRLILGLTDKKIQADHRDGDGLNNSRANLRPATNAQNCANRHVRKVTINTPFWGVTKKCNKWEVRVNIDGKNRYIGRYATAEEAAHARDVKAIELHGEFARLNFP